MFIKKKARITRAFETPEQGRERGTQALRRCGYYTLLYPVSTATIHPMKVSIHNLTREQIRAIAPLVPTSEATLRQVAHSNRGVSAERAISIEHAAAKLGITITRESMNAGCAKCVFAKACRALQKTRIRKVNGR